MGLMYIDLQEVYYMYKNETTESMKFYYYDSGTNKLIYSCDETPSDSFEWDNEGALHISVQFQIDTYQNSHYYQKATLDWHLYMWLCQDITYTITADPTLSDSSIPNYYYDTKYTITWGTTNDYYYSKTTLAKNKRDLETYSQEIIHEQVVSNAPSNASTLYILLELQIPLTGSFMTPVQQPDSAIIMWKLDSSITLNP
jgi:hypothetical protein